VGAFLYKVLLENKTKCKEKLPVKVENSASEVVQVFKEMQGHPGKVLEMVRADMPKVDGGYL